MVRCKLRELSRPCAMDSLKSPLLALSIALAANASAQTFEIDLPANAVAYSALTKKMYATIADSGGPVYGGKLIEISPLNAQILNSVSLASDPGPLAISPDNPIAYVGFKVVADVQPIDLGSMSAAPAFQTPYYVQQIAVMPSAPASIAVSMGSGGQGTVAVFDNGVMRGSINGSLPGANSIGFDSQSKMLFGYDNYDTNFTLSKFSVEPSGVNLVASAYNMIRGFGATLVVDNGTIYASTGASVDAAQLSLVGTYQSSGPLVVDDSSRSVIFAHGNLLQVFDRDTFVPIFSLTLQGAQGNATGATGCGAGCVGVIFDSGQIFIAHGVSDNVFKDGFELPSPAAQ